MICDDFKKPHDMKIKIKNIHTIFQKKFKKNI